MLPTTDATVLAAVDMPLTSFSTFLMDKTPDLLWDQAFRKFLVDAGIAFEEV